MYTWFITYTCRGKSYVAAGELCATDMDARVSLSRYLTLNPCDEGRKVTALHIIQLVKPIKYEQTCLQERAL